MSQYPPPPVQPPIDYAAPQIPTPPRRPTSVTVLAIIGIIFGALGVLCTPFGLIPYFVDFGQPNPVIDAIKENKFAFFWTIGSSILGILLAVILLAGSIGSLKLAPWARSAMLAYAAMAVVMSLVGTVISVTVITPLVTKAFENMQGGGGAFAAMGGMIGAIVGAVLMLIYPICILFFFNTEKVKSAFANPPESVI